MHSTLYLFVPSELFNSLTSGMYCPYLVTWTNIPFSYTATRTEMDFFTIYYFVALHIICNLVTAEQGKVNKLFVHSTILIFALLLKD